MYDILLKVEVPAFHACDESLEGLGILCNENVAYNRVYLLRHQNDDPKAWPLDGKDHVRYAVYVCDSEVDYSPDSDHELDLGRTDNAQVYLGSRPEMMTRFTTMQTLMLQEANRLLDHRDDGTRSIDLPQDHGTRNPFEGRYTV